MNKRQYQNRLNKMLLGEDGANTPILIGLIKKELNRLGFKVTVPSSFPDNKFVSLGSVDVVNDFPAHMQELVFASATVEIKAGISESENAAEIVFEYSWKNVDKGTNGFRSRWIWRNGKWGRI
jgi:hypothetical protein